MPGIFGIFNRQVNLKVVDKVRVAVSECPSHTFADPQTYRNPTFWTPQADVILLLSMRRRSPM